jgi:hypothetical protein
MYYLVKWEGYPDIYNSWEISSNFPVSILKSKAHDRAKFKNRMKPSTEKSKNLRKIRAKKSTK